uniref:Uncharacterized protein n=1 Tax=Lactuca sativa TaxID=4236 RepID=A0A9R1VX74_LACSA|nr:hypothetical protein LSAT_V11C400201960 [Lactuca sativa]
MPRRNSARLNLNQRPEPQQQQQPQPPPRETNRPISLVELEEIIAHRIAAALANVTRGGVRNEASVQTNVRYDLMRVPSLMQHLHGGTTR